MTADSGQVGKSIAHKQPPGKQLCKSPCAGNSVQSGNHMQGKGSRYFGFLDLLPVATTPHSNTEATKH